MMALNKNYKPVEALENDEIFRNGIFEWNITKIIQYISQNKSDICISKTDVTKHYRLECSFSNINQDYVNSVDISIPVIQVEINPDKYLTIDGHHRLVKAFNDGIKYIDSYKLNVDQHIQFFISVKSYTSFVEYWNSKVRDQRE